MKKPTKPTTVSATLRTYSKDLPCVLSDDEWHARASDLAACIDDIANEEGRQANLKSQMKAALAELDARKHRLASVVRAGVEYREVTVELRAEWAAGVAVEVRTDTGESMSTRALTDSERQPSLLSTEAP